MLVLGGCGSKDPEVIDLDRVLEVLDEVAKAEAPDEVADGQTAQKLAPLNNEDPDRQSAFLAAFAKALNDAKLISQHVGVAMHDDGSIRGFADRDRDARRDSGEEELFKLEIDPESGRVIASQDVAGQTYRRDHHYTHHHYHGGYWGYWLYGSMWGRQRDYYRSPGRSAPDYSRMNMSSPNYHTNAVNRARSSYSSARSTGGSRGFFGGK
jgi:hypothetical protein